VKWLEHEDSDQTVGIKVFLVNPALKRGAKVYNTTFIFPGYKLIKEKHQQL
jgi:hypothetical protein